MTDRYHSYDPAQGHGLPHDPFKGIVVPRPIGWISTVSPEGIANLAPYSFFNAFSSAPPIIGFSSDHEKDSLANIRQTREFVFNLVSFDLVTEMNITSASVDKSIDEFELAGLASTPSFQVKPRRVAASPAALECKVTDIIRLRSLAGEIENVLVLGQVVHVHIDKRLLREGLFDPAAAQVVARCGYRGDYAKLDKLFQLTRPGVVS